MTSRIPDAIRRVFTETFTARDIAESLASFDADASSTSVEAFMQSSDCDVVGIRSDGCVVGYVRRGMLEGDRCGQNQIPFDETTVIDGSTPLPAVLMKINREPVLFVRVLGSVGGIITRADLQKPAVRMLLFGIVTVVELRFTELIERYCPDERWKQYVSEGRLQKAEALLIERQRRNQALRVFDCLQFADKAQIVARDESVRSHTIFQSRRQAQDTTKELEMLRNSLAHAQDIVTSDWETIIRLCEFVTQTNPGDKTEL